MNDNAIILASQSPRRREILTHLGISHSIRQFDFDEEIPAHIDALDAPEFLARQKAEFALLHCSESKPILCADTLVMIDGIALGKPIDQDHALQMLQMLSGKKHIVRTGIALVTSSQRIISSHAETEVLFRDLDHIEIHHYLATNEYQDKAGSYAIQGYGARLIDKINGCFYNVMGLPISATLNLLKESHS